MSIPKRHVGRAVIVLLAVSMAMFVLICAVASQVFGSLGFAVRWANGECVFVSPAVTHIERDRTGNQRISVTIRNFSGRSVLLAGGVADCTCIRFHGLPMSITGWGETQAELIVNTEVKDRGATGMHRFPFFTDIPGQSQIGGEVHW